MANTWHKTRDMNMIKACLSGKTPKDNASSQFERWTKDRERQTAKFMSVQKILDL